MPGKTDVEKAKNWIQETFKIHRTPNPDLKKVIAGYKKGLSFDPANPEGHYFLGVAYLGLGQFAQAIEEFELALKIRPDFPDVHFHYAQGLINLKRYEEAAQHLEKAHKANDQAAPVIYSLAYVYQMLRRDDKAAETFATAYKLQPLDKNGVMQYLTFLLNARKTDQAAEVVGKFLETYPEDKEILNLKAVVLMNQQQADEAENLLVSLAGKHPREAGILLNLGQIYEAKQNWVDAEKTYRKVIGLAPKHLPAYGKLGISLARQQKIDDAFEAYADGLAINPKDLTIRYLKALLLIDTRKTDDAEVLLKEVLEEQPNFREAQEALQKLNVARGTIARSPEDIQKELADKPDDPRLLHELGRAYLMAQNYPEAEATLIKAEDALKTDVKFLADLGFAFSGQINQDRSKLEPARNYLQASLDLDPNQPRLLLQMTRLALTEMNPEAAIEYAERYRKIEKSDGSVMNLLGFAWAQKGFPQEALKHFQKSMEFQSENNRDAVINLAQLSDFTGDYDTAEKYYHQWAEFPDADSVPLNRLAVMKARAGELVESVALYDQLQQQYPEEAQLFFMQAIALKDLGRSSDAVEKLQEAVRLRPDYQEAATLLKQLESSRPLGQASLEELEQSVAEDPNDFDDKYLLANLYFDMRRFADAVDLLQEVVEHDEQNHRARYMLSESLFIQQETDRAINVMIDLEEKIPTDPGIRFRLAQMLSANEEYALAIKEYQHVNEMIPGNPDFLYHTALAYIHDDHEEKGEEFLRKALEINDKHALARLELAKLEMTSDRHDHALASFERAFQDNRNLVDALYFMGLIQRNEKKDPVKALQLFRAVVSNRFKSPDAHLQLAELLIEDAPADARLHLQTALSFMDEEDFNYDRARKMLSELDANAD